MEAYHGSTVVGASLCGESYYHEMDGLPIPDIEHIECPYWYKNGGDLSKDDYGLKAARALENKTTKKKDPDQARNKKNISSVKSINRN